jgi:hypothetical protein
VGCVECLGVALDDEGRTEPACLFDDRTPTHPPPPHPHTLDTDHTNPTHAHPIQTTHTHPTYIHTYIQHIPTPIKIHKRLTGRGRAGGEPTSVSQGKFGPRGGPPVFPPLRFVAGGAWVVYIVYIFMCVCIE